MNPSSSALLAARFPDLGALGTSHIRFEDGVLTLLDQRALPGQQTTVTCRDVRETASAITAMVVRGAPAIGITAAYGMALAAAAGEDLHQAAAHLDAARPTAVNLRWATRQLRSLPRHEVLDAAFRIHADDIAANLAMGRAGAALLPPDARVLTHCNAGALATGGWGTALGVVRAAYATGRCRSVWVDETRPWLQGARLTAWELANDGIPVTLIADVAAASLLQAGLVDAVVVGADRIAANGDVANKVGTLGLAMMCRMTGVPFYVAAPHSTIDLETPTGTAIPIEHRDPTEVRSAYGVVGAANVPCHNPVFDVTPFGLVTAIVTETGRWRPPGPTHP